MALRRTLFITRSLSSARGGMQLYTSTLVSELSARTDVRLTIVSFSGPKIFLPFFALYAAVRGICFRGDTVHVTDAALSSVALPIRLLRPSLHLTLATYGLDVTYPSRFYQSLLRFTLPGFSKIVAHSRATEQALIVRGVDPRRVVVLPGGIRMPVSSDSISHAIVPRVGNPLFLLLGRQIKRKGTAWFLTDVFPSILRTHPSALCMIAGDGPELPHIRSVIAELSLEKNVRMLGEVDEATKEKLYREATLFVMPNVPVSGDMEGFGLVCAEAAAYGLPVAAARLEGIQDAVLDGVTGLFFSPEDAADATRVIETALVKTWDRSAMIAACAERYAVSVLATRYVSDVF